MQPAALSQVTDVWETGPHTRCIMQWASIQLRQDRLQSRIIWQ